LKAIQPSFTSLLLNPAVLLLLPFPPTDKVFRELFCGHTSAFLVDTDGTEWDCLVSIETRNDMRLQYTLRGQFQEYWDAAGVKSGDVLTFQRNTPTAGKIKVGRYPQGRGLESALDTAGNCHSNATTTTGSKESTIAAAASKIAAPLPLSNLGPREPKNTSGSQRIREQQQRRQDGAAVAEAGGASGHPNRWTELPDGSAAKTVYKSTLAHQQCPVAGWLYRKLYSRTPADVDTAPMRDPALATDFLFEVAFVPAANVHYISGRAFSGWMKAAGVQSGDQIRVWRDQSGVKICRMANNNPSRLAGGGGLVGEGLNEDGNALPLETFTSPPGVEALAALNALAAAAGYAGQHGTPAIDAVLSHAADLRNLVTSGQQEVDTLLSIGYALKTRLAEAGMPTPPSPFLMSAAAGGMEKKRKNENLGASDTIVKQPRLNSNVHVPPSAPTAPIPVVPPPPAAAAAGGTGVAQPPPSQIQLQQALQHLIRHYQMHHHQQQQQPPFPATARPAAPVLFHRATPALPPPPPSQPIAPAKQQPTAPSMHSNKSVWSKAAPSLNPKQQQPEETREEEQHEAVEKQN
jgi:hypothetical protein